jgi:DNA-directed RNA polymerase subunit RPC12/RpoP
MALAWNGFTNLPSGEYVCGFCGKVVASATGYLSKVPNHKIYICPHCGNPTFFQGSTQVPGVAPGVEVLNLPEDIQVLYREARNCVSAGCQTAAVLTCRKLLMNVAVGLGADPNKSFISYVEYLAEKGYVPPNGKGWVDHIRKKGNEANHEIRLMTQPDAEELISFSEMLLKFIYEFPSRVPKGAT